MTALQRQQHQARMATLRTVRLIVEDGTLVVRPKVFCEREIRGHRLIPRTVITY